VSLYRRFSFANIVGMLAFVLLSIIPATPARCELTEQQRGHLTAALLSLADDAEEASAAYSDYLDSIVDALSLIEPGDPEHPEALAMITEIEFYTSLCDAIGNSSDPSEVYDNTALLLQAAEENELPHFATTQSIEKLEDWVGWLALWAADELEEPQNTEEYEDAIDDINAVSSQILAARDGYSSYASEVRENTRGGGKDFAKQLVECLVYGTLGGPAMLGGLQAMKAWQMISLGVSKALGWWVTAGVAILICVLCIWGEW